MKGHMKINFSSEIDMISERSSCMDSEVIANEEENYVKVKMEVV